MEALLSWMKWLYLFSTAQKRLSLEQTLVDGFPISYGLLMFLISIRLEFLFSLFCSFIHKLLFAQDKRIQKTTGSRSLDNKQSFPLMLRLDHYEGDDSVVCLSDTATSTTPFYTANIWVFTNMSGMLLVTGDSLIIDCNPVFSQLALGYTREQLIGKV